MVRSASARAARLLARDADGDARWLAADAEVAEVPFSGRPEVILMVRPAAPVAEAPRPPVVEPHPDAEPEPE